MRTEKKAIPIWVTISKFVPYILHIIGFYIHLLQILIYSREAKGTTDTSLQSQIILPCNLFNIHHIGKHIK
jgi:hypothetical protein